MVWEGFKGRWNFAGGWRWCWREGGLVGLWWLDDMFMLLHGTVIKRKGEDEGWSVLILFVW